MANRLYFMEDDSTRIVPESEIKTSIKFGDLDYIYAREDQGHISQSFVDGFKVWLKKNNETCNINTINCYGDEIGYDSWFGYMHTIENIGDDTNLDIDIIESLPDGDIVLNNVEEWKHLATESYDDYGDEIILTGDHITYIMSIIGKQWGDLPQELQDSLLDCASAIDGRTGEKAGPGECIVDFIGYDCSIAGRVIKYEDSVGIEVNDESVFYCSFA